MDRTARSADVLGGASYVAYISPGLMVTTAMAVASAESLWPILGGFVWNRSYFGISATPLGPTDIVGGHALWMATRCIVTRIMVAAVLVCFPEARSWGLIPAIPVSAFTGLAFAMPLMAFSAKRVHDAGFAAMQRFVIVPLFFFGGAFYPISQLPRWTQAIIKVLPLWHGVELARSFTVGHFDGSETTMHVVVPLCWIVGGTALARRFVRRRLYV